MEFLGNILQRRSIIHSVTKMWQATTVIEFILYFDGKLDYQGKERLGGKTICSDEQGTERF